MNSNNNRFKKLVYSYDLISGKVNQVAYQSHQPDQFYHRYSYDVENRLTEVETSLDSVVWDKDARYEYYKHGPLARMVLGNQLVQGVDYAYTLQGWLKGINSTALTPNYDMGGDGDTSQANRYVGRDAVSFNLNYFAGDYSTINTGVQPFPGYSAYLNTAYRPLYNGNISSIGVNIGKFEGPVLYNYRYDRLNRLTAMDMWKGFDTATNSWSPLTISTDYKERIKYDPNGNILTYVRNTAGTTSPMDSMRYQYYAGTNRLSHIIDDASLGVGGNDIKNQGTDNYVYDEIGNLTGDASEHMSGNKIKWNVYGKITEINRDSATSSSHTRQINYYYDAGGNRIGKKVSYFDSSVVVYTWYVRDASGNVMSVYTAKKDTTVSAALSDFELTLSEQQVYGSSRLGIQNRNQDVEAGYSPGHLFTHTSGERYYELSNHLGNVLATVSDRKVGVALSSDSSLIGYYKADVINAQDYYPFGMLMAGRSGYKTRYGWAVSGSGGSGSGSTLPGLLTLDSRSGNAPSEYKASEEVRFEDGFVSGGSGDSFDAYVTSGGEWVSVRV